MAPRGHEVRQHRSPVAGIEVMSLATSHRFPRHSHDQFGIGLLAFGGHRSWSGLGTVEAGPGELITVNPGEIHDGMPCDGRPRGWRMLYLDPALVSRELRHELSGPLEISRPVLRDPRLAWDFARLFAGLTDAQPDPLAAEEHLLRLLLRLLGRHGLARPVESGLPPPVARTLRRLDQAPESPVSLAELAADAGLSRFQLLRGFARATGITPHAYLLQRRVLLARRLLAAGSSPVDAAAQAGFADQSHLTRAFRRQFGITPGHFRDALA
jgi:AraC-like DNA-binding protein